MHVYLGLNANLLNVFVDVFSNYPLYTISTILKVKSYGYSICISRGIEILIPGVSSCENY